MARLRYSGDMEVLAKVVRLHIVAKEDLIYPSTGKAKLVKPTLIEWRDFLRQLCALQSNMSFTKEGMMQACTQAASKAHSKEQALEFARHVAPRIRA
eukprot:6485427-Amphidinium_carterae.1